MGWASGGRDVDPLSPDHRLPLARNGLNPPSPPVILPVSLSASLGRYSLSGQDGLGMKIGVLVEHLASPYGSGSQAGFATACGTQPWFGTVLRGDPKFCLAINGWRTWSLVWRVWHWVLISACVDFWFRDDVSGPVPFKRSELQGWLP